MAITVTLYCYTCTYVMCSTEECQSKIEPLEEKKKKEKVNQLLIVV